MYKFAFLMWAFLVDNMFIYLRKMCVRLSTRGLYGDTQLGFYPHNTLKMPIDTPRNPHHLSATISPISPPLNTTFTQFPQHLLLLQRKKI